MNYKNWSNRKFWFIIFATFFIGMLIAPIKTKTVEKVVTKEVPKEVIKEVVKEVPTKFDDSNWRNLKTIDDQAISYATEDLGYCAQGFSAIGNGDITTLNAILPKIEAVTPKVQDLGVQRQEILRKLGY